MDDISVNSIHMDINHSKLRSFDTSYNNFFIKNNYFIVDPSKYNVFELSALLNNAKKYNFILGCKIIY